MNSVPGNLEEGRIEPGTVIANYVVEDFVGQGTEGCVYVARDSLLGRQVALKTSRAGSIGETRGVEEARLLSGLEHPNIVRVYQAKRQNGIWFVAFEYLSGGSLQAQLQRLGQLPLRRALEMAAQAAGALAYVHEAGILHRDIKPQNLLLSKAGELKLADFGLALSLSGVQRPTAQPVGTPAFLAPELWLGNPASKACDVFSLGACLFCLLTGRPPFVALNSEQLRRAHLELEPNVPLALPASVRELVLAMMAKDPEARPASQGLAEALRALAQNPRRFRTSQPRLPQLQPAGPFAELGAEQAAKNVLRAGADAATLGEIQAALRTRPRGIEIAALTTDDALLFSEVLRDTEGERCALVARLSLPKPESTLLELIVRKLELPPDSTLAVACRRLLEPADELSGLGLIELCVRGVSDAQRREIEVLASAAQAKNVLCLIVGARGDTPHCEGFRCIDASPAEDPQALEARLSLWIGLATAGKYTFSRDGLRLASAVCREQRRFWSRLAQDSALIAAAAGLPVVTSWAVLGARAQTTPLHSVDEVASQWRRRPSVWPTVEVAARLTQLREHGESAWLRERVTGGPITMPPMPDPRLAADTRTLASNT